LIAKNLSISSTLINYKRFDTDVQIKKAKLIKRIANTGKHFLMQTVSHIFELGVMLKRHTNK